MKTLQELEDIRNKVRGKMLLYDKENIRVVVGMATCGVAAGAKPVLEIFNKEIEKRGLKNVTVVKTGCIGVCRLEPIVEVYTPQDGRVTYVKMTPEMAVQVINEHIVNGNVCMQYTIGAAEKKKIKAIGEEIKQ